MAAEGGAAAPEGALVDRRYLARLGRHLGHLALDELLEDGLIELVDRRARLEGARRGGSASDIGALAHDLVALSGHLGLAPLSQAAAMLDRRARDGNAAAARQAAVAVVALIDRSIDALAAATKDKS